VDAASLAVLLGLCGTIISAISAVVIAVIVNRREKQDSTAASADKLEEKWRQFKDEQIHLLREENATLRIKWADAEARADAAEKRADRMRITTNEPPIDNQERIDDRE
jgi:hypothetical protein